MKKLLAAVFVFYFAGSAAKILAEPVGVSTQPAVNVSTQPKVDVSTATGNEILYDNLTGVAVIQGDAVIYTATATLKADKMTVNTKEKQGHLEGNVTIEQTSGTIKGSEMFYDWQASTGLIYNAEGVSPPWRFTADKMIQESEKKFRLYNGYLTSCDENPPHYKIRSSSGEVEPGKRATMKNARFIVDDTPAFWTPYYSRSLVPKKYTLRVEPGSSSRDGLIAKTTFGYPFTPNTFTHLKWDYFDQTGNGYGLDHSYYLQNVKGNFNTYYIKDVNPDPTPESKRFDLNWNHWEKFTSRLTGTARIQYKSDQNFGNQFLGSGSEGRVENATRGVLSEAGLNYQFPRSSLQMDLDRTDRFDSTVSSKSFVGQVTLPRLAYNTVPIKYKWNPFYTSFNASYSNQTQDRLSPTENLKYRQTATSGLQFKKDIRPSKVLTLTPNFGINETWQDSDFSTSSATTDIYQTRTNVGLDLRRRFFRYTDLTLGENYVVRSQKNSLSRDEGADDRGIETNAMGASLVTRMGRSTRTTLASGFDFRQAPRNDPTKYDHLSERFRPPSLDVQIEATKNVGIYFRETYSLFDTATKTSERRPLNTSGEIQLAQPQKSLTFSQGFNYSEPLPGQDSELILNNKLKFYLTPRWYVDLFLSYRAVGESGMNYSKVHPIERTIRVVRDLHCWILRMEFSSRPDRSEASFYIDLKTNLSPQKNVFRQSGYTPFIYEPMDTSSLFPATTQEPQK